MTNKNVYYEGNIIGLDEYMNLVIQNTHEINLKTDETTDLGLIMLKGDTISDISQEK